MDDQVKLIYDGKTYEFPIITGSEGEKAIDISGLLKETGLITLDPGYVNTGSCISNITYMDGEKGILRHRGISIEELAKHSSFIETVYLLINDTFPTMKELNHMSVRLNDHSLVHEDMQIFFQNYPRSSHPMGILSSMVTAIRSFYPELRAPETELSEDINITVTRILSKVRTLAAMSYKISGGDKVVYPRPDLSFCANFLNMMFDSPVKPYEVDDDIVEALNTFWILHTDHEQNCSTAAVRLVGSGRVNLYAAISAGIAALWGPLHGGANQAVIEMLTDMLENGRSVSEIIEKAKDKAYRIMGFGHRVYKTYDPRAKIMKETCDKILEKLRRHDPLLDLAKELELAALNDDYFIENDLYPNVDFYSGIILRAIGIPINMFTVMFAIGRLPGWVAQWKESREDPNWKLNRPRQIYMGSKERKYIPIDER